MPSWFAYNALKNGRARFATSLLSTGGGVEGDPVVALAEPATRSVCYVPAELASTLISK
jgi:hypothetical protein